MGAANHLRILAALVSVGAAVSGCAVEGDAAAAGPTCAHLIAMDEAGRKQAVLDWAERHDPRYEGDQGQAGFALFQDYRSLVTYCQQDANADHEIMSLSPR